MGHNIEQGAGAVCRLLKFKGFVASVPTLLKLIVACFARPKVRSRRTNISVANQYFFSQNCWRAGGGGNCWQTGGLLLYRTLHTSTC
jgi:hypothetical protein